MSLIQIGTYSGYPLYGDTQTRDCYLWENGEYVYWGDCPGNVNFPASQTTPPFIAGNTSSPGGGYIQPGQSWFNDLLNTLLGLTALGNQGTIQGGAINPAQVQPNYNYPQGGLSASQAEQLAAIQRERSVGGQFGAGLQNFLQNNSLLVLGGVVALVLWKSGRK